MPLTDVYTFSERSDMIKEAIDICKIFQRQNEQLQKYRDELQSPQIEEGYALIKTEMDAMIPDMDYMRDRAVTILNSINFIYDHFVRAYKNSAFSTLTVDINAGGSGRTTITANGGAPFTGYAANDVINISGSSVSDRNGNWTVYSVDGTNRVLTLTTDLSGADGTDSGMLIRLDKQYSP